MRYILVTALLLTACAPYEPNVVNKGDSYAADLKDCQNKNDGKNHRASSFGMFGLIGLAAASASDDKDIMKSNSQFINDCMKA